MALKQPKVKDAAESHPMTMCDYLGHFKQAKFMAMGHNSNGSAVNEPGPEPVSDLSYDPQTQGPSNLWRGDMSRVDAPTSEENYKTNQATLVDQMLKNAPTAPDPVTEVRDPGRGNGIGVGGPIRLADVITQATSSIPKPWVGGAGNRPGYVRPI